MLSRYRTDLRWLLLAIGAVWLAWAFPLLQDARHYFQGDTQNAYYGWFHHFGVALLNGQWPMLDAQTGSAGNPLAEGQQGLYSPLSALIAIGAAVAPQMVVYAALVKFGIATIAIIGCYLLARDYGVRPGLAAVAAVAIQLCGFTRRPMRPDGSPGSSWPRYCPGRGGPLVGCSPGRTPGPPWSRAGCWSRRATSLGPCTSSWSSAGSCWRSC